MHTAYQLLVIVHHCIMITAEQAKKEKEEKLKSKLAYSDAPQVRNNTRYYSV